MIFLFCRRLTKSFIDGHEQDDTVTAGEDGVVMMEETDAKDDDEVDDNMV
jgi:hypothetical protein